MTFSRYPIDRVHGLPLHWSSVGVAKSKDAAWKCRFVGIVKISEGSDLSRMEL